MAAGSHPLLHLFRAPELKSGQAARLIWRGAVPPRILRGHVQECLNLVVEIGLGLGAVEHPPQDGGQAMHQPHAPSSTQPTASETRFHRSRWRSSCRFPAAVIR